MSKIKLTNESIENAILRDSKLVGGYVDGNGYISASGDGIIVFADSTNGGVIDASGYGSFARGYTNSGTISATGNGVHAEGFAWTGTISAKGAGAHADGYARDGSIDASGNGAHAEGYNTKALANGAHAEGRDTIANGVYSHAEGYKTTASGTASHAGGIGTIANQNAMTAIGKYNSSVNTNNTLFVVGNGTDTNNRKDAFVIKNNGDVLINPLNSSLLISLYDLIYKVSSSYLIYSNHFNKKVELKTDALPTIISHTYSNGYGLIVFDTACTNIGDGAF